MPGERDRIILDTNLLISFLITNDFSKFERIVAKSSAKVLFSKNLLDELIEEVAQRPRFRKWFPLTNRPQKILACCKKRGGIRKNHEFHKCMS